jgi:hypothetical protein
MTLHFLMNPCNPLGIRSNVVVCLFFLFVSSSSLLVVGCWLLVVGCWLLKKDRIDYCNGRDDKCGRIESNLTRSSAVLAILRRDLSDRSVGRPKTKTGPVSPEIKKSGLISNLQYCMLSILLYDNSC